MIKKILKIFIFSLLLGVLLAGGAIYYVLLSPNTDFKEKKFILYIPTGSSYQTVIDSLYPKLSHENTFFWVAKYMGYTEHVRPGRYVVHKGMNNLALVRMLRNRSQPIKVSFNNQERLPLLAARIAQEIEADSASLMKATLNPFFLYEHQMDSLNVLGLFIPNTYEFYWNTSAEEFVHRMGKEYKTFWNDSRRERADSLGLSPKQVSILASIVQKESYRVSERPTIAGVYLNRLRQRIPLQADPTVIYAIKETSGNYDTIIKRVYLKDLQIESPYNTYLHPGLPPSPICMPDISSIDAVLHPQQHDYIFFVADTARLGYHKFAKTLQEHNKNRDAYRKWLDRKTLTSKEKGEQ